MDAGQAIALIDIVARESMLFAGVGILIGGIDDLLIDAVFVALALWRSGKPRRWPAPRADRRMVIFVPAWDEAAVIGAMLRSALARLRHGDYRIYIGVYPNDRATIDAIGEVDDPRIRLVIGDVTGPTTKADCLNSLWRALQRDEAEDPDGVQAAAIVLHDAEDVIHGEELTLIDRLIGEYGAVQLPVLPLIDPRSRLVSGHYADEFAEAHGKSLVVREAMGRGLPLAGVGCGIAREVLERIAVERRGDPFDAVSLTEDYELGLTIGALGFRTAFARMRGSAGDLIAVRAYFPSTIAASVRQKARWMTGIALAGWDRTGWGRPLDLRDHWMRMRDRRAPLAVLVLGAAYLGLVAWALAAGLRQVTGAPGLILPVPAALLAANTLLLGWRLGSRAAFTGATYGWREAIWSVPRALVGNIIALLAARRAIGRYIRLLAGGPPVWDKTAHQFPDQLPEPQR